MVALFVVLFIIIMFSIDMIANRKKNRELFGLSEKERLVAKSAPSELGLTMTDGGELIDREEDPK